MLFVPLHRKSAASSGRQVKPPRRIMDIPLIGIEDLKRRMDVHEALAVLDSRAADAWKSSDSQIPGSIRCASCRGG
jgi:hypothetical protein